MHHGAVVRAATGDTKPIDQVNSRYQANDPRPDSVDQSVRRLPTADHGVLQQLVEPEQLPEITRKILSQVRGAELSHCQLLGNEECPALDPLESG